MQPGDENPYRAPASEVAEVRLGENLVDAGKWRRFFNWLLDYVAILVMAFFMTLVVVIAGGMSVVQWAEGLGFWGQQLAGILILLAYYTIMEGMFGLTFGKWITRTRVVDEQGAPPTWRQAVLRSLARMVPFEPFSVLFGEDGVPRGWHDRWPRTRVVLRTSMLSPAKRAGVVA